MPSSPCGLPTSSVKSVLVLPPCTATPSLSTTLNLFQEALMYLHMSSIPLLSILKEIWLNCGLGEHACHEGRVPTGFEDCPIPRSVLSFRI